MNVCGKGEGGGGYLGKYDWELSSPEEDVGVSERSGAEYLTGEVVGLLGQEIKILPHYLGSD